MTINKTIIGKIERTYGKSLPDSFKWYLLLKYAEEPFPYEYSEQDLYANILNDIRDYEAGKLDITVKSQTERWQEERNYLCSLYIEKCCEVRNLEEYIAELEHILSKYGLESSRMTKHGIEHSAGLSF